MDSVCCARSGSSVSRGLSAAGCRRGCAVSVSPEFAVRVALITPAYGPLGGGAGRLVQALARQLTAELGAKSEVILHTQDDGFVAEARRDGVPMQHFRPPTAGVDYAI